MDYSVRSGDADHLIRTLRGFADDRASHGKTERAVAARAAAEQLEAEGLAHYEGVYYVAGGGDADNYAVREWTRAAIEADLVQADEGWAHQGRPDLAQAAREQLARVRGGATWARVGHIVYVVRA